MGHRPRVSNAQLYGIARFIAYGGRYHNFYMLTGGNNYGRLSGGEVPTTPPPPTHPYSFYPLILLLYVGLSYL